MRMAGSQVDSQHEARPSPPRAVDLRRQRTPDVAILACSTYDLLLSLHVALASPDYEYADFDIGPGWIEQARARLAAADPAASALLRRYFGSSQSGSLHATLISLVWECPPPRDAEQFITWLGELPNAQFLRVLLDQEDLGDDWPALLDAVLAEVTPDGRERHPAAGQLLARFADDVRPTVANVLRDPLAARAELLAALRVWNTAVFAAERERLIPLLRREAAVLERQRAEMAPDRFVKLAMRGVEWQRPAGFRRIIFAPSYFCRPAVFYHFWQGTLTFCVPVEAEVIEEAAGARAADPRAPSEEVLNFFEALGEETRLRILRLLAEREMYLTEISERLGLTKATTKHHMVKLRAAGLVTLYDRDRMTYYALRPDIARHAAQLLEGYLGRPSLA
jgi:DNA-binding transcriptional ArsR family regulator